MDEFCKERQVAPRKQEESHTHPRPGAFVVMMIGLFLFFGMVSRIGKINQPQVLLSGAVETEATPARDALQEERSRVIAVIGGENPADTPAQPVQDVRPAPAPVVPAPVRPAPQHRPAPRRSGPGQRAYVVRENDTLYSIARVVYGDGNKWTEIVSANPGLSPETMRVGMQLVLPHMGDQPGSYSYNYNHTGTQD